MLLVHTRLRPFSALEKLTNIDQSKPLKLRKMITTPRSSLKLTFTLANGFLRPQPSGSSMSSWPQRTPEWEESSIVWLGTSFQSPTLTASSSPTLTIACGGRPDRSTTFSAEALIQTATSSSTLTVKSETLEFSRFLIKTLLILVGGASRLACSDTYMGPEAFSEKESKALADFFESISDKADAYVSFHSAAELLLYPMGHTNSIEQVHNVDDLVWNIWNLALPFETEKSSLGRHCWSNCNSVG